jgi:hypothetical protein
MTTPSPLLAATRAKDAEALHATLAAATPWDIRQAIEEAAGTGQADLLGVLLEACPPPPHRPLRLTQALKAAAEVSQARCVALLLPYMDPEEWERLIQTAAIAARWDVVDALLPGYSPGLTRADTHHRLLSVLLPNPALFTRFCDMIGEIGPGQIWADAQSPKVTASREMLWARVSPVQLWSHLQFSEAQPFARAQFTQQTLQNLRKNMAENENNAIKLVQAASKGEVEKIEQLLELSLHPDGLALALHRGVNHPEVIGLLLALDPSPQEVLPALQHAVLKGMAESAHLLLSQVESCAIPDGILATAAFLHHRDILVRLLKMKVSPAALSNAVLHALWGETNDDLDLLLEQAPITPEIILDVAWADKDEYLARLLPAVPIEEVFWEAVASVSAGTDNRETEVANKVLALMAPRVSPALCHEALPHIDPACHEVLRPFATKHELQVGMAPGSPPPRQAKRL